MPRLWIQDMFKKRKAGEGAFHRQLGVPQSQKIPVTLLEKIRRTEIGRTIRNPTQTGDHRIKVTRLVKQRGVALLNLDRLPRRRR